MTGEVLTEFPTIEGADLWNGPSIRDAHGEFWDVWCEFDGDTFYLCDESGIPEWLEHFLSCCSLFEALGEGCDEVTIALSLGIAPYQPFLVRFREPKHWHDYWGEWDSDDLSGDVIGVAPMSVDSVVQAWEEWAKGYENAH